MKQTFADMKVGQIARTVERMELESRVTLRMRREGVSDLPGYIPTYLLSVTQGLPGERPRYQWQAGLYPYPQHSFGRQPCEVFERLK